LGGPALVLKRGKYYNSRKTGKPAADKPGQNLLAPVEKPQKTVDWAGLKGVGSPQNIGGEEFLPCQSGTICKNYD
jgi:hypothetical protein